MLSGTTNGKPPTSSTGVEGSYFQDYATGNIYGPRTSGQWPSTPVGNAFASGINGFAGLQFAIAQGSLGNPSGTMTGYAAGDNITLQCAGVTFSSAPKVGVTGATGGLITGAAVTIPGVTSGAVPSGTVSCSQASTTGSGSGYQVTAILGLVASYVNPSTLATGGPANANQNFFLNWNPGDTPNIAFSTAGPENTFIGDLAGFALTGNSGYNTAIGNSACAGVAGTGSAATSDVTCIGSDAGRNIQSGVSSTLIGYGAGRNLAGGYNTFIGAFSGSPLASNPGSVTGTYNTATGFSSLTALTSGNFNAAFGEGAAIALTQGAQNAAIGFNSLFTCTSCGGVTALGSKAGNAIITGTNDIIIQATNGADNCSNGDESNVIAICAGAGRIWTTTGAGTPGTAVNKISGAIVSIGTAPTLTTGSCSGSSWVGGAVVGKFTAATCAAGTYILSGLPAAPNGYVCNAQDQTTPADTLKQTANSTTSCTLTSTTVASDVIVVSAVGF